MQARKLVTLIAVALAALVLVTGAAIWLWANSHAAARFAGGKLSELTGLPSTIGALSVGFLPGPALRLQQVELGQPEGFGPDALLAIEDASVSLSWASLLSRSFALSSVALDGVSLRLQITDAGGDNWSSLVERLGEMGGEGPATFRVDGFSLERGMIDYRNAGQAEATWSTTLALSAEGIVPREVFPMKLRLAGQGSGYTAHLNMEAKASLDPDAGRHAVDEARLTGWLGGGELPLAGLDFSGGWSRAEVNIAQSSASISSGQWLAAGLNAQWQLELQFSDVSIVNFELQSKSFAPRAVANAVGTPLPETADPAAFTNATIGLVGTVDSGGVQISSLRGELDETKFEGEAGIRSGAPPRMRLNLDRLVLDRYLEPDKRSQKSSVEATLEDSVKALEALEIDAELRFDELVVRDVRLRKALIRVEPSDKPRP